VFLSVSPRLGGVRFSGDAGDTTPGLCRWFCCWPPQHAVLGIAATPGGESFPRFQTLDPGFVGAPLRRLLDDPRCADEWTGRIARPVRMMGQGAHHLRPSLAPALPNPLLRRGIGASSLPAPPRSNDATGTGRLAQGDDDCANGTWRRGRTLAIWPTNCCDVVRARVQDAPVGPETTMLATVARALPERVDSRNRARYVRRRRYDGTSNVAIAARPLVTT
jgi:hypothetical protein